MTDHPKLRDQPLKISDDRAFHENTMVSGIVLS